MAYETKVILAGLAGYIKSRKSSGLNEQAVRELKGMYDYITEMANVEGVVLKPFDTEDETKN